MDKRTILNVLNEGARTIERLTQDNRVLHEKLRLVEGMIGMARVPDRSMGMGENPAWPLAREAKIISEEIDRDDKQLAFDRLTKEMSHKVVMP